MNWSIWAPVLSSIVGGGIVGVTAWRVAVRQTDATLAVARSEADEKIEAARLAAATELTTKDRALLDRREERIYAEQERLQKALSAELERRTAASEAAITALQRAIDNSRVEEQVLREEIDRLANKLTVLTIENQQLRGENLRLTQQVNQLTTELGGFKLRMGDTG